MTDQCVPVREPEIPSAHNDITYELSICESLVIDLENRIKPLCREAPKSPTDAARNSISKTRESPFAQQLQSVASRISEVNHILRTIHERLEV